MHSISLKVKVRTKFNFDKSYNEAAAQDYDKKRIGELAEKIKKVGYCNLGGEYGSWTVDVSNYTWFGLPWGGLYFTCNGIRTKLPGFHNTI